MYFINKQPIGLNMAFAHILKFFRINQCVVAVSLGQWLFICKK